MTDFTNYPIWANAGTITQPLFVNSGWVCGTVDPEHMNWWFNRTDNALISLDTRLTTAETNITTLQSDVDGLTQSLQASGVLGVYVADSNASISKFKLNSAGDSNATVMKTFDHTIQSTGDVHLMVGYEANVVISPYQTSNCVGVVRLLVNNNYVLVNKYGSLKNGNPRAPVTFQGGASVMRHIHGSYDWALIGQSPFPTYHAGDSVQLKLDAFLSQGHSGSIDLGFLKLVVIEMRATTN